jgi:hypothetical protein
MSTRNWDSSFITKHRAERIVSYAFRQKMASGLPNLMNPQTGLQTSSQFVAVKDGNIAVNYRAFGTTVAESCCGAPYDPAANVIVDNESTS